MTKHTATKEKLLDKAIELIWQSNYSNVGVNDICQQAGVTKGSFYHYFETKADLFYEASRHYWEGMKKDLDALYSPTFTPLEHLENLIQFVINKQDKTKPQDGNPVSGCPFFTAGGQAGSGEDRVREASREMSERCVTYNMALVRNLKAEHLLNGDPDPLQLARLLHHYVQGLLIYGRVCADLRVVKTDLREGIYRLIDLKQEYRQPWPDESGSSFEEEPLELTGKA